MYYLTIPGNWNSKESRDKTTKAVKAVSISTGDIFIFSSQKEASDTLGVSKSNISSAVSGKRRQAGGYFFERLEK